MHLAFKIFIFTYPSLSYIARKINGNKFAIAGGAPNAEVSWMVTGIRHDKYADEHRIPVEEIKTDEEKANYGKPVKIPDRHPMVNN